MAFTTVSVKPSASKVWSLVGFIKRYWYYIVLLCFILPVIVTSIMTAIETDNPLYPVFALTTHLLASDQYIEHDVNMLKDGKVAELVGMEKPTEGLWQHTKYYWKWFWNIPVTMIGYIWTLLFPFITLLKIIHLKDTSKRYKTFFLTLIIFLIIMFITNIVIMMHGLVSGNIFIDMPQGIDEMKKYWIIFVEILPFHGFVGLLTYIFQLITGTFPIPI